MSLDSTEDEVHVVVTDPDGKMVSVSGPDEIFRLIALANHALPEGERRRIDRRVLEVLRAREEGTIARLVEVLEAMLRPNRDLRVPACCRRAGDCSRCHMQ